LSLEQGRAVTVNGAVRVAQLAAEHGSRLLMVSGFMLENQAHLAHRYRFERPAADGLAGAVPAGGRL